MTNINKSFRGKLENQWGHSIWSFLYRRESIFGIVAMLFSITALSATPADDLYQKMISAYGKLNSWKAVINQTNKFQQSNSTLKSTGTFYYQRGKLAIRYNKPNEQQLVIQNGKLEIYDKSNNTVYKSTLDSAVGSLNPVEIVKSYWAKSSHAITGTAKGFSTLKIIPRQDPSIQDITLKVETSTGYIHQFQYTDKAGNSLNISFIKIKLNPSLPTAVFKLNYPKTAKIFEQ